MKLVYTGQAIASLAECLDFFPLEVPVEKIIEIRDRILAKADKLWQTPISDNMKNTLSTWVNHIEELLRAHIKSSTGSTKKPLSSPTF